MSKARITRAQVVEMVEQLLAHVRQWEAADEPVAQWHGRETKVISQALCESAVEVFDQLETDRIEPDARELVLAVDRFQQSLVRWAQRIESNPMHTDPQGGGEVWGPWNEVLRLLEPRKRRTPSPIPILMEQKVSHRQIAKEYGWYLLDGTPDERKVLAEIAEPGKHYDPARYIHPHDAAHDARIQQAWEERCESLGEGSEFGRKSRGEQPRQEPREWRAPAETIEELIRQAVPLNQIAKMHRVPVEEVKRIGAEIGAWIDPDVVRYAHQQTEAARKKRHELEIAKINSHPEHGQDLDDRVLAISLDGHPPGVVAQVMQRNGFPQVSMQLVTAILQRIDSEKAEDEEAGKPEAAAK